MSLLLLIVILEKLFPIPAAWELKLVIPKVASVWMLSLNPNYLPDRIGAKLKHIFLWTQVFHLSKCHMHTTHTAFQCVWCCCFLSAEKEWQTTQGIHMRVCCLLVLSCTRLYAVNGRRVSHECSKKAAAVFCLFCVYACAASSRV